MTTLKINCQLKIFEMIFILTILYNIPRKIFFAIPFCNYKQKNYFIRKIEN